MRRVYIKWLIESRNNLTSDTVVTVSKSLPCDTNNGPGTPHQKCSHQIKSVILMAVLMRILSINGNL